MVHLLTQRFLLKPSISVFYLPPPLVLKCSMLYLYLIFSKLEYLQKINKTSRVISYYMMGRRSL